MSPKRHFVLLACVFIVRLQLAYLLERQHCHFHLAQRYLGLSLSIEAFDVRGVELNCLTSVEEGQLVLLHLETRKGAVAIEDGFLLWRDLAEDRFCVVFASFSELLVYTPKSVSEQRAVLMSRRGSDQNAVTYS